MNVSPHAPVLLALTYVSALVIELSIPESGGICFGDLCLWPLKTLQHQFVICPGETLTDTGVAERIAKAFEKKVFGFIPQLFENEFGVGEAVS